MGNSQFKQHIDMKTKKQLPVRDSAYRNIGIRVMVFNAIFNNNSVITWRLVLLVEETGVHGESCRPVESH